MTQRSVAVGATVRAGLSDLGAAIKACWAALVLATVLAAVSRLLPPAAALLAPVLQLVALSLAAGALYRRRFERASGLKGLRWGREEWHLMAAQLLCAAFLFVVLSVLALVVAAVTLGVARMSLPGFDALSPAGWQDALAASGVAGFVVGLVPLLSLAIIVWLAARLSLAGAATVDLAGIRVLSSFPLTRGLAAPILASGFLLALPVILLGAGLRFAGGTDHGGLEPVVAICSAAAVYFYLAPVWTGALVHIYRQRRPTDASQTLDA
ncbi:MULTISPECIES: hypothetical protein [unclassified Caulobacter]|uniref:hypothetical protein n=1 Tax=unclassified Caulobacter TaxID=2648921 RepID=UPI000D39CEF2|nr:MULTISPECIES: hypothetical protein [unclassified Caulobacter]PTS89778.1 hypothetical protein DBR21_05435 [Caulobacter sp. HMWF009]PTT11509.1 hypothetical protein DBR10_03255 [Caulobacter sp. HMWF025]PTT72357.1 hypothetical protein DBR41_29645 [Pseudomonas sp. HMWF010]